MEDKTLIEGEDIRGRGNKVVGRTSTQTIGENGPYYSGMVEATLGACFVGGSYAGSRRRIEEIKGWFDRHCEQIHGLVEVDIKISKR